MHPFSFFRAALLITLALGANLAHAGPDIQQWVAPTGARVNFVESHELPMIDIQVDFAAGSAHDPLGKSGVANFTHALLDAGTNELDEQAIADKYADLGIIVGGGVDDDRASLKLRTLSSAAERDAAVYLLASLLAQPTFPLDVLERERARSRAGLKEMLTKPGALAARAFNTAIYGAHPYGVNTDADSLSAITRDDLLAFHDRHYNARNASITLVGDLDRATAEHIVLVLTFGLPVGDEPAPLPEPTLPEAREEKIANPSAQAHILLGLPGIRRDDPDYFPLVVGNYVLGGGGFVSRLTHEVRERRGLAYSVSSHFEPRQVAGPFVIGLQTKGSQSGFALRLVRDTLAGFIADGPSDEELQAAKDNLVNGFGLRLDSNRKILDYVSMIGFYRLPADWLERYPRAVEAVTREAVQEAFARRLPQDHLVAVTAGGDGDPATVAETPAPDETAIETPAETEPETEAEPETETEAAQ
ncbi:MAG: insulinase family protein [Azoarcus sp.]|jgi:zinc protease|nr:insulinase family protein [Azoarcus sp.]